MHSSPDTTVEHVEVLRTEGPKSLMRTAASGGHSLHDAIEVVEQLLEACSETLPLLEDATFRGPETAQRFSRLLAMLDEDAEKAVAVLARTVRASRPIARKSQLTLLHELAAKRCVDENAKWPDPMDKCLLKPGTCPVCLEAGAQSLELRETTGAIVVRHRPFGSSDDEIVGPFPSTKDAEAYGKQHFETGRWAVERTRDPSLAA